MQILFTTANMAYKRSDDLIPKILFGLVAFLVLGLLSWITGEDDPINLIWSSFWAIAMVVGSISIIIFLIGTFSELFKRK